MRPFPFICLFLLTQIHVRSQELTSAQYKEDFLFLWQTVRNNFAYGDKKQTDWEKVEKLYGSRMDTVSSRKSFVLILEKVFNEFYDAHSSPNTNYGESQRLIPSGTDTWVEYVDNKPVITELRRGSGAALCGLKPGMEILAVNGRPVEKAIQEYMPHCLVKPDPEARNHALRLLVAGKFIDNRSITVRDGSGEKIYYPDQPQPMHVLGQKESTPVESKILPGGVGYIIINNRLWDNNIIPLFDSVLLTLQHSKSLILDMRNTPSGGNTTVARAIMGSFIQKPGYYQQHEDVTEERDYGIRRGWVEIVWPRKWTYDKPMAVLCNHWTGSVGEGICIGFDALGRASIVGTPMARLNGANYSFQMPHSKIGFSFPAEKLYHVNGTPREAFNPTFIVDQSGTSSADPILDRALMLLNNK